MYAGPDIIMDGLVFGYDTNYGVANNSTDTRYYPGEPTTNLKSGSQTSGQIAGMQGVGLTYVGEEDGYSKYSMSGTFSAGTYPYSMYLFGVSFTGGLSYSTQCILKTNVENKFNYFGGGINYVNLPMNSSGTNSSVLQTDGSHLIKRQGFNYVPTTNQAGYIHSNPVNNTTFNSSTDFIYIKNFQIEQNTHCTPWTATSRSNTASLIDLKNTIPIDLSAISFDSTAQPEFDGVDDSIPLASNLQNGDGAGSWEFVVNFDQCHNVDTSTYRQIYIQENSIWVAQYFGYIGIDIKKDNGNWFDGNGGIVTGSQIGPVVKDTWYHGVFTFNQGVIKGYLNGALNFTTTVSGMTAIQNGNTPRYIGRRTGQFLDGELPIFKVYNIALSQTEVTQNYNAQKNRFL